MNKSIILLIILLVNGSISNSIAQGWNTPRPDNGQGVFSSAPMLDPKKSQSDQQLLIQRQNNAIFEYGNQAHIRRNAQLGEIRQELDEAKQPRLTQAAFAAMNKSQYERAYQILLSMLQEEHTCNLRQAVFTVENVFLANQLKYADFSANLNYLAKLCRSLAADTLRPNPAVRFLALHRLMTDTVRFQVSGLKHLPPVYDFEDFWGREDFTKQFVTKLLRTNSGQCRSLPLLYKLLADELGIKAYLSMAPNHLYIQVKDNKGELYSYETTNGHFVSDAYYLGSGYIKAGALKNRSYLDTLSRRETIAFCLFDLMQGYTYRYGYDAFVEGGVARGLSFYPQSVQGRMLAHNAAFMKFVEAWKSAGRPPQTEVTRHPELVPLFEEVQRRTRAVEELGHEDMPAEQYAQWLKQVDAEKNRILEQKSADRFVQSVY